MAMAIREPLAICDAAAGRHAWVEPFTDGDTCSCGWFYLHLHTPTGFAAEIQETPSIEIEIDDEELVVQEQG